MTKNIEHIKEIVAMQQSYARVSGVLEVQPVAELMEDALRIHLAGLARHQVRVVREFEPIADLPLDKHKILQILVNLISNAKYALSGSQAGERLLTMGVRIVSSQPAAVNSQLSAAGGRRPADSPGLRDARIEIFVKDNGKGIPRENLTRIFSHGFTTRRDGHGFGLHSGALAAKEMGGTLTVQSDGEGKGATFTLQLPVQSDMINT